MTGKQKRVFSPLPAPGDIVWCKFPQLLGVPGPKSRPALVVRVSATDNAVSVAYGTSQKTTTLYPTEFVLDPNDPGFPPSGLSHRTKFDLGNLVQLSFDTDWFEPAPGSPGHVPPPKMGILHSYYMAAVQTAAQARR